MNKRGGRRPQNNPEQRSRDARILQAIRHGERRRTIAEREGVEVYVVYNVTARSYDRVASNLGHLHNLWDKRGTWSISDSLDEIKRQISARYSWIDERQREHRSRRAFIAVLRRKGVTYRAIAAELGISPARVTQIHDKTERMVRYRVRKANEKLGGHSPETLIESIEMFGALDDAVNDWLRHGPSR